MRGSAASIAVSAVVALSSWNLTTTIRIDKEVTMLIERKADTAIVHEIAKTQAVLAEVIKRLEVKDVQKQ